VPPERPGMPILVGRSTKQRMETSVLIIRGSSDMWTFEHQRAIRKVSTPVLYLSVCLAAAFGQTRSRPSTTGPSSGSSGQAEANRAATATLPGRAPYAPMTEKERLVYYLKASVNPIAFIRDGAGAAIGQWRDSPKEWREGARGYQFRYESAFGEHIVKESLEFTTSSIFQEDNRFRPSGESGFGTRLGYGITSAFSARHSDGSRHFSFSKVLSFAGAALISREWQPESTGHLKNAGANFGSMLGAAVGFDVLKEFWPRRR